MSNASSFRTPKYRRHKAKGLALVTLNGRDIYLGKYGSAESKRKYRQLVAEYLQRGGASPLTQPEEITVIEVMAAYTKHAKNYYRKDGKPTREYGMIVEVCRAIRPLYGKALAVDFGPLALKSVRQSLVIAGFARTHINRQIDRVKRMFRWAAAEELIPASVPQALSMVSGLRAGRTTARESTPVQPVDNAIVDATLVHLPEIVADMVRFQRLTGCRPAEVCQLRPCDVDRSDDVWAYRPASHKTEHHGRDRTIFVGPKAQGILLRYLVRNSQDYCFRPCDTESKRRVAATAARVTPQNQGNTRGSNRKRKPKRTPGEQYTTGSYGRAIRRGCLKAFPIPDTLSNHERELWIAKHCWSPNRLRHTTATQIRREFGLEAAQVILGHSKADVTQTYAERDIAKGMEVARRIG
ncbi:MAG: tyrosine-type recombinase/integrase [Bythopirellula sp.]